ncbi:hypothetical protein K503DRAFT_864504 [Rhizopogon vinicolor AM-OR11-026]|uniref:Uncharacterized protein n=1 Tax=Rhizopogon vinicolor AM-OR11-026 TaxID=1314800 RepID=A0A1B7N6W7_9AGAM|nr:hypothetical protein K503DRAFT_864504 [Rhizopogon vinicolor AM-OR11-026]
MSFYTGVVPADRLSAQAGVTRTHPQANPQSPIYVGATSPAAVQPNAYPAPVTPAQAYARSVVAGQPTLHYIIERQQPSKLSAQQPAPLLQSPVEVSPSPRGQSYAQRLYASALGKQPQPQTTLQTDIRPLSSEPSGEPDSDLRALPSGRPSRPYGARPRVVSSLMLNLHNDNISSPHPASALDFYHNSVSKLGLRSPVSDGSTSSPGAARPQSVMSSSSPVSVPHSPRPSISQTTQPFYDMQAPSGRDLVSVANSNVPPPSSARDYQLSNAPELHSRRSPSPVPTLAVPVTSAQISLQGSNSVASPPTSSELLPRVFSPNSEGHSGDIAQSVAISSRPESATRNSHIEPIRRASPDLGPEEVPLYSLVDDTPPPPDFDESQSICSAHAPPSVYHAETQVVLSPPVAPSPSPSPPLHEFGPVYGVIDSTGADTPALPCNISPDPIPESPRLSPAMEEVPSYYPEKALVYITEKSYGYPAEDFVPQLPEKARSYATKEHLSSSRTPSEWTPAYRQRGYNVCSDEVRRPPASSAVTTYHVGTGNTSAKAFSTVPPSTPLPAVSTPAPITPPVRAPTLPAASPQLSSKPSAVTSVSIRPETSLPLRHGSAIQPYSPPPLPARVREEFKLSHSPMLPVASPPLNPTPSAVNSLNIQPEAPLPLPGSAIQPSSPPPLPLRARAEFSSPPSLASSPPSVASPTGTPSQPYLMASYSHLPSPSSQRSQPSVSSTPSTSSHPAEFRPQLSPPVSPAWYGEAQVPYQSPVQGFQPQASQSPSQHPRAQNVTARSPQSSRVLGGITAGIAGGALGLLGGAVLAEALGGNDVVDDLAGNMAGMSFGDPTGGLLDSGMGGGDQYQFFGSGFDSTGSQGDQTFSGDSSVPTYDVGDPNMGMGCGLDSDQAAGSQGQPSALPDSYFTSEQVQETQQVDTTQVFDGSQYQQQPGDQNGGTHYLHDAEQILQAAYKIYNASQQQSGVAQGIQGPQTTAPFQQSMSANPGTSYHSSLPNLPPVSNVQTSTAGPSAGAHVTTSHPTQHLGQSTYLTTSPTVQQATFSPHHPSANPVSQQTATHPLSHHHAAQGSHTQNPYMHHAAYPSSGIATQSTMSMSSHGPMPAHHGVQYGYGTPHATSALHPSLGSHAHVHSAPHPHLPQAQGHAQQQFHAQANPNQHPSNVGSVQNKAALARQFVKGALIAGGVLAKYNNLNGGGNGGGFFGNGG